MTSLFPLIEQGTIDAIVSAVSRAGPAAINTQNNRQEFLLHVAARRGTKEVMSALLKHGAKVNCLDGMARTPLHIVSEAGNPEAVQLLINSGAQMDNQDRKFMTALHYAASNNHSAVVDVLCRSGANLEETNMQGETALNLACSNMHLDVVRILVGYNANYNKPDHGGVYPLQRLSIDALPQLETDVLAASFRQAAKELKVLVNNPSSFPDVKISVNRKDYFAHKAILFAKCPQLLKKMVNDRIVIDGTAENVLLYILEYIYTGNIEFENGELDLNFAFELAKKGIELNIPKLKNFCENLIISNLDPETVGAIFSVASFNNNERVMQYCAKYFFTHYAEVVNRNSLPEPADVAKMISVVSPAEIRKSELQQQQAAPRKLEPSPQPAPKPPVHNDSLNLPINAADDKKGKPKADRKTKKNQTTPPPVTPPVSAPKKQHTPPQAVAAPPTAAAKQQGAATQKGKQPFDILTDRIEQEFKSLLGELMANPDAPQFNEPVTEEGLKESGITNYFIIVQHPMDLGTIWGKAARGEYKFVRQIAGDIRLVWDNARTFNLPESDIYQRADRLSKLFERRYTDLKRMFQFPDNYDLVKIPQTPEYFTNLFSQRLSEYYAKNPQALPQAQPLPAAHPQPIKQNSGKTTRTGEKGVKNVRKSTGAGTKRKADQIAGNGANAQIDLTAQLQAQTAAAPVRQIPPPHVPQQAPPPQPQPAPRQAPQPQPQHHPMAPQPAHQPLPPRQAQPPQPMMPQQPTQTQMPRQAPPPHVPQQAPPPQPQPHVPQPPPQQSHYQNLMVTQLSTDEQLILSDRLNSLNPDQMAKVVDIIALQQSNTSDSEIEIDIDSLDIKTQRALQQYVLSVTGGGSMGPATNPFNVASGAPPPRLAAEEPANKRQKTHHDYGMNGGGYMSGVSPQQLNPMQSQQQRGVLY
jgi:hypothetical protein